MTVRIPIAADAAQVTRSFETIRDAIRRAGQEGRAFSELDLSHPELARFANDIQTIRRNLEDLRRVGRGETAAAARALIDESGSNLFTEHGYIGQLVRRYPETGRAQRVTANTGRYIFQGTQFAPTGSAPAGQAGVGAGGGASPGGGGGAPAAAGAAGIAGSLMGGLMGGIGFLLGQAGLGKIAQMAGQAVQQAQDEATATDMLLRHMRGAGEDFAKLRDGVRAATDGLQLTYQEAQRLSLQWVSLTNQRGGPDTESKIRFATGFARGYGLDPSSAVNALGRAQFAGQDPREFAQLIADAVSQGGMTGQVQETMQAMLRWADTAARTVMTTGASRDWLSGFASLYTGMNASGEPGLKGAAGESLIASMNNAVMQGGGAGNASMALMYRAMRSAGITDPYQVQYLQSGGMFQKVGNTTLGQLLDNQLNEIYKGQDPYRLYAAGAREFNISPQQYAAFHRYASYANTTRGAEWLGKNHINLSTMDPSALGDVMDVINAKDGAELNGQRDRVLRRGDLSGDERATLQNSSGDALRKALVDILSTHGMDQTEATRMQQSMADFTNRLTDVGTGLVPVLTDLKSVLSDLTSAVGDLSTFLGDKYDGLHGGPKSSASLGLTLKPGQREALLAPGAPRGALPADIEAEARKQAAEVGIDPDHFVALLREEGGGYDRISPMGAWGPGQLMPQTALRYGVKSGDWRDNIRGSAQYYADLYKQFGNKSVADAAYNAGPNGRGLALFAQTGDPSRLPAETQRYLQDIARMDMSWAAPNGTRQEISIAPLDVTIRDGRGNVISKHALPVTGNTLPAPVNPKPASPARSPYSPQDIPTASQAKPGELPVSHYSAHGAYQVPGWHADGVNSV